MPRSVLCLQCGNDLYRVRTQAVGERDDFRIRLCPDCGTASAVPPRQHAGREARHFITGVGLLAIQVALVVTLLALFLATVVFAADEYDVLYQGIRSEIFLFLFTVSITPICLGFWVAITLTHWKWRAIWSLLYGLFLLTLLVIFVVDSVDRFQWTAFNLDEMSRFQWVGESKTMVIQGWIAGTLMFVVAQLGTLLAVPIRKLLDVLRRRLRQRVRDRRRTA